MLTALGLFLVAAQGGEDPQQQQQQQLPRRGAIPLGVSLSGGLGVTEGLFAGSPDVAVHFTQEVALAVELTPRWVVQAALRVARGSAPATIAVSGTVQHRFVVAPRQRFVPFAGAGLVVAGVSSRDGNSGLGAGVAAEGGLELRIASFFGVFLRAAWTFVIGGLNAPMSHFFHQTTGLTLSL